MDSSNFPFVKISCHTVVIGRRVLGGVVMACSFWIPLITCWSLGVSCLANSSCFPAATWKLQSSEKYTLMVEEVIPLVAKCAVNNSKVSSDVGIVGLPAISQKRRYLFSPVL